MNTEELVQDSVLQNPTVIARSEQIRQIDAKLRELQHLLKNSDAPQIVRLKSEREICRGELDQLKKSVEQRVRDRLQEAESHAPISNTQSIEKQLGLVKEEESFLQKTILDLESTLVRTGGASSVELEIIRHQIAREKELADSLWKSLQEMKIEEQAEPRISIMPMPSDGIKLNRSKQLKAVAVGVLFGILIAVLGVGYFEWTSFRVRAPEEVSHRLGLDAFGIFTGYTRSSWLNWFGKWETERVSNGPSEVASMLLLRANPSGNIPSVFVTSATESETRSYFSHDLALALASNGLQVLLIDCDVTEKILRHAWSAQRTQIRNDVCSQFEIQSSDRLDYDYLSMGQIERSLSWFAAQGLPTIVRQASSFYDSIIVQGPSILNTAESVLIASQISCSLMVMETGNTRWNYLAAAVHRLKLSGSNILGVVESKNQRTLDIPRERINKASGSHSSEIASDWNSPEVTIREQIDSLQKELIAHETHVHVQAPKNSRLHREHRASTANRNSE